MAAAILKPGLLYLLLSSVLLMLPKRIECTSSDPDDESWSARVGLSGVDRWATDSGVLHEATASGAITNDDRKDGLTPDDSESEGFRGSRGENDFDSINQTDQGVDNIGAGVSESDIDAGESGIGDESDDEGADDVEFAVKTVKYDVDEVDFDFQESDFDFDKGDFENGEFDFEDSDFYFDNGFDNGDYEFDGNDYASDASENEYDFSDSDYEYDYSDYDFDYYDVEDEYSDNDSVRSGYDYSDPDYDYDDDSDYDYGDEVDDWFDRFERRFDSEYETDDSTGDDDPDGDFDDEIDGISFGSRRRSGRTSSQRRGGGRREHHDRVRTLSAWPARSNSDAEDRTDIEIDDASANPEDIPSGYFERQVGGMAPTTSGSIDFPGFRLLIREGNDWWKFNENVCLSKEFQRSPTETEEEEDPDKSVYTVKCNGLSLTEYSCNVTELNDTVSTSYRLTYACCRGFTRLSADRGCPRRIQKSATSNLSFVALLRKHSYSQRIIDLFGTVLGNDTKKQWTIFVPPKRELENALSKLNFMESKEEPVPEWFVRTILNHFVPSARSTGSLRSDQVLPTLAKTGGGLLITKTKHGEVLANCRPIEKSNQPFNHYSFVHFTSSVLRIQQSNLYQLMVKHLESVVSLERAKKLLSPIKSILTGARPLTVFMHLPSKDEMDNNCYNRNLRATIVSGAECNASLATLNPLRTIDGKVVKISKFRKSVLIGGNRLLITTDLLASNGVLHIVNATESLTGFENVVTRRLKSSDLFKPLFNKPGRTEGSLAVLIPPNNGSYSYTNTSARWSNTTELTVFGRRHMLDNATGLMGHTVRLAMLDGIQRDFVQLLSRQTSTSIFGPDKPVRHRFVDCVQIVQTAKNCGGVIYMFLRKALPDFLASPTIKKYLNSSNSMRFYGVVRSIVKFALLRNVTDLANRLRREDVALVLLKDADMHILSGGLLARRRPPTAEQMLKLTSWFTRYFVASKQICAVKTLAPYVTVPVLQLERRPCRSIICAFRRQVSGDLRRIQLRPDSLVTVREGFLLPGKLAS